MDTTAAPAIREADRPVALVVDDDPDTRALISYTLERGGWSVRQARDGEQALMLAREHVPEVMVLDLALPRLSGLGVLRALKSWPDQPTAVVVVSAFSACAYLPVLLQADAIVKKSFRPSALLAEVNRVARAPRLISWGYALDDLTLYDLTPPISDELPVWPGDPPPRQRWLSRLAAGDPAGSSLSEWVLGSHTGAHVDAPSHFIAGGAPVEQVSLATLIGACVVLDLTSARGDVGPHDLPPDLPERVLLKTRNSLRAWPREAFRLDYVGLSPDAAVHLVERGVRLVGADYLSIESFASVEAGAPVHRLLLGRGVVILEGLLLTDVPPGAYQLVALPLHLAGSEAAPTRVVLL